MTGLPVDAAPATALRLARLHLRTGMLRLARLELEQLAGAAALDTEGILDLAEVRWRTGDLRGAAEAAGAWSFAWTRRGTSRPGSARRRRSTIGSSPRSRRSPRSTP